MHKHGLLHTHRCSWCLGVHTVVKMKADCWMLPGALIDSSLEAAHWTPAHLGHGVEGQQLYAAGIGLAQLVHHLRRDQPGTAGVAGAVRRTGAIQDQAPGDGITHALMLC
jgi:hypothetical protein